jgi:hypothetical protein
VNVTLGIAELFRVARTRAGEPVSVCRGCSAEAVVRRGVERITMSHEPTCATCRALQPLLVEAEQAGKPVQHRVAGRVVTMKHVLRAAA